MKPLLMLAAAALALFALSQDEFAWQEIGDETYTQHCASCHQPDGEGVEGVFPRLVGNEFLLGDAQAVIDLVLHGRGAMPAFEGILSDEQIAAVISHERNAWGNEAEPVTPEMVLAQRDTDGEAEGETEDAAAQTDTSQPDAAQAQTAQTETMPEVTLAEGWQEHGAELYAANCSACHQDDGEGVPRDGTRGYYPNLAGNAYVVSDPASVIATIIHGRGGMPSFRGGLSSEEIAHVLSYVRTAWGNEGSLIGPEMVEDVAQGRLSPADPNDPNYRPGAAN